MAKVWVSHYSEDGFWLLGSQKADPVLTAALQLRGGQLARVCKSPARSVQTNLRCFTPLSLHSLCLLSSAGTGTSKT